MFFPFIVKQLQHSRLVMTSFLYIGKRKVKKFLVKGNIGFLKLLVKCCLAINKNKCSHNIHWKTVGSNVLFSHIKTLPWLVPADHVHCSIEKDLTSERCIFSGRLFGTVQLRTVLFKDTATQCNDFICFLGGIMCWIHTEHLIAFTTCRCF